MAAADVSPPENPLPDLLTRVGFRKRRTRHGSATQLLWNKLEHDAALYELCRAGRSQTAEERVTLELCRQKLEVARRCIDKRFWRWSFTFWEIIHEVDGLLLLVMPSAMLLPKALEIQHQFERRVLDPLNRELWLGADGTSGPLPQATRMLSRIGRPPGEPPYPPPPDAEQLLRCRHVLLGALGVVNGKVDKTFWQLSVNVAIQVLSTVLLLMLFVLALQAFNANLVKDWPEQVLPKGMLLLGLAGAGGAVLSNMLSKERFLVATGATSRYFAYHLLVKPVIGGIAALVLLFLEQSNLLLAVIPREASTPAAISAPATPGEATANVAPANAEPHGAARNAAPSESTSPSGGAGTSDADVNNPAILHLVVSTRKAAFFTMVALSIVSGFSADRLLSSVIDSVLRRLLRQSEKVLSPTAPPAADAPPGGTERR
ncbi:hypothetical protein JY651_26195 [Pyxidicoccus parkwayensis]|uniref:Uncharacterized protein n=1 Tax=Pyxidicoccus parkwayensis TaxID=2813578 RepID=A0ABX7NJ31_9BACT|nr:hypothetical protein [Pyxidicoccus parkwaysis]QSQ18851.1 hypothetical protein JY651_26195 [Pyxidicoccus parkwaysis]